MKHVLKRVVLIFRLFLTILTIFFHFVIRFIFSAFYLFWICFQEMKPFHGPVLSPLCWDEQSTMDRMKHLFWGDVGLIVSTWASESLVPLPEEDCEEIAPDFWNGNWSYFTCLLFGWQFCRGTISFFILGSLVDHKMFVCGSIILCLVDGYLPNARWFCSLKAPRKSPSIYWPLEPIISNFRQNSKNAKWIFSPIDIGLLRSDKVPTSQSQGQYLTSPPTLSSTKERKGRNFHCDLAGRYRGKRRTRELWSAHKIHPDSYSKSQLYCN